MKTSVLGERVNEWRVEKKLSKRAAARQLGIALSTLQNIELGIPIDIETAEKTAPGLKRKPAWSLPYTLYKESKTR